ncbi:MAG: alpha/beta fold hydrolase [Pikeienuella sp.]
MSEIAPHRVGTPTPLISHLTAAIGILETGARLAPAAPTAEQGSAATESTWSSPPPQQLSNAIRAAAQTNPHGLALALRVEAANRLMAMLDGLRKYQTHPAQRDLAEMPTVWRAGGVRLLDYGPSNGRPVLVTPSLVNRYHVLDLDKGDSLIRYLSANNLRPLVVDWGEPRATESRMNLGDYVAQRLIPAFDAALALTGAAQTAVFGYCMGGALSLALADARPEEVSKLAIMGAPWDFSGMAPMRGALAGLIPGGPEAAIQSATNAAAAFGALPADMLQQVFARLDPGLALKKFRQFAAMDQESAAAKRFVLIEDWLNDGPPLSGPAAVEALTDWQKGNVTMKGDWKVDGMPVDPTTLHPPAMVFAATRDRIAPPAATEPLAQLIPGARLVRPETGHVGMIVGRAARAQVWAPLVDFLQD